MNNGYCTPEPIIYFARYVMGSIDTDPASNEVAQRTIQATEYFTKNTNGLIRCWHGNVWLNPPYSASLIKMYIDEVAIALKDKSIHKIKSIMVLVNSSTDTSWYHRLLNIMTSMVLWRGRISFFLDGVQQCQNCVGQTLFLHTTSAEVMNKFCTQDFGYLITLKHSNCRCEHDKI